MVSQGSVCNRGLARGLAPCTVSPYMCGCVGPHQYVTGHMFAKYDLPSLELKVRTLKDVHNYKWDEDKGNVSGGVVTHTGTDTEVRVWGVLGGHVLADGTMVPHT